MRQPLAALDHYAAALPKRDPGRGAWYQPERDTVVDDWVAWAELEQNGRRLLALGTAYVRHGEVFVLNVKDGSDTRNRLPTRDPGTLILNEHPLDCAIQHLFTEHAT